MKVYELGKENLSFSRVKKLGWLKLSRLREGVPEVVGTTDFCKQTLGEVIDGPLDPKDSPIDSL